MEQNYGEFIVKVIETLKSNGFPENQVTLPLEKMYEVAHSKGLNFNKVLAFLEEKEGICHQKTDEKILFFPSEPESSSQPSPFDLSNLDEMMKQGEGMPGPMGNLMKQAKDMMDNMSPDQLQGMMKMFENMSEDQKSDMMKKAKDMGLF